MRYVRRCVFLLAAAALLAIAGCASQPKAGTVRQQIAAIPAKNLKNYRFDPEQPIADRIQPAPGFVLKSLMQMDGRDDYAAYQPTEAEKQLVLQYLDLLPAWFDAMLKERLVAIYFIENFTGAAMTEFVLDSADTIHAFIVINPATLGKGLSEWMTLREQSCFSGASSGADEVFVDCGTRYQALLYALVHECGHVADYVYHYTPWTEPAIKEIGLGVVGTPFVENIWSDYAKPEERADFSGRGDITFYGTDGGPKIPMASAPDLYRALSNSPFPSLYAAQNWAEDFAECFTWYFFTTRLGESYRMGIRRGGAVETEYEPIYWSRVVHRFPQLDPLVQDTRK